MNEDIRTLEINTVKELVQKYITVVEKALGIEAVHGREESLEVDCTLVSEEVVENYPAKRLTAAELDEEKCYVLQKRAENRARLAESRAMFAESQAKFAESRSKFVNRLRMKSRYSQQQTDSNQN